MWEGLKRLFLTRIAAVAWLACLAFFIHPRTDTPFGQLPVSVMDEVVFVVLMMWCVAAGDRCVFMLQK